MKNQHVNPLSRGTMGGGSIHTSGIFGEFLNLSIGEPTSTMALTLFHVGFFRATIYVGGGSFHPPSENSLILFRIQYNLAPL